MLINRPVSAAARQLATRAHIGALYGCPDAQGYRCVQLLAQIRTGTFNAAGCQSHPLRHFRVRGLVHVTSFSSPWIHSPVHSSTHSPPGTRVFLVLLRCFFRRCLPCLRHHHTAAPICSSKTHLIPSCLALPSLRLSRHLSPAPPHTHPDRLGLSTLPPSPPPPLSLTVDSIIASSPCSPRVSPFSTIMIRP